MDALVGQASPGAAQKKKHRPAGAVRCFLLEHIVDAVG